jgi:cytochrome P450
VHDVLSSDTLPGSMLETLRTGNPGETPSQLGFWMVFVTMDTTTGTVAAALDLLARDAVLQEKIRDTPSLIPAFIRETLRLASPFRRLNRRLALESFDLGGVQVEAGQILIPHVERAHRDPDAFPEPAVLDLARQGPPVLSFGAGAHACLGSTFGTQQVQLLLEALLERIVLRPAPERGRLVPHIDLRHFATLPLSLSLA